MLQWLLSTSHRNPAGIDRKARGSPPSGEGSGSSWGKVEVGETVERALIREVREELAVDCDPSSIAPLMRIHHHYSDKSVLLDVWTVSRFAGVPGCRGQPIRWVEPSELCQYDFPEANQAIVRTLMLPTPYIIHSETSQGWESCRIFRLFGNGRHCLDFRPFIKPALM